MALNVMTKVNPKFVIAVNQEKADNHAIYYSNKCRRCGRMMIYFPLPYWPTAQHLGPLPPAIMGTSTWATLWDGCRRLTGNFSTCELIVDTVTNDLNVLSPSASQSVVSL